MCRVGRGSGAGFAGGRKLVRRLHLVGDLCLGKSLERRHRCLLGHEMQFLVLLFAMTRMHVLQRCVSMTTLGRFLAEMTVRIVLVDCRKELARGAWSSGSSLLHLVAL